MKTDSLPDLSDLTDDQEDALRTILNRIHNGYDHTKLNGRAGVGKTYVTARLVKCLLELDVGEVVVTAPTHEAKNQLRSALPPHLVGRVELSTIHSALDLTMRWSKDRKVLTKKSPWEPLDPDVLIVDEASMIGNQLADHEADMHSTTTSTVWIGDDGQLPPVNQNSAGVLDYPGPTLDEIVRQAKGSPVIEMSSMIRDAENDWVERVMEFVDGKEVHAVPKADAADRVAKRFENAKGLYDARVLAFRNATVSEWNQAVSERLFPSSDHWEEGMRAMARETWLGPEDRLGPLHTSEMYEVVSAEPGLDDVGRTGPIGGVRLKTWELELSPAHRAGTVTARVLDPSAKPDYEDEKDRRLDLCRKGQMEWQAFYGLVEDVADVDYGYASTVHKAQGATITDVFCDYGDLVTAPGGEHQIQPLAYVAVTRASDSFTFVV